MMHASCGRVAIIGGGKMGEAVLSGWIEASCGPAKDVDASCMTVVEPDQARRDFLGQHYGIRCVADIRDMAGFSDAACGGADVCSEGDTTDIVVLAVKPQVMMEVLADIRAASGLWQKASSVLFVSIAAGLTTDRLQNGLPQGARLVRVMPNTPLMVGAGASAVCAGSTASEDDLELVRDLFSCLGIAIAVPESSMDAVCALSGSGPAYVAFMIEALRDAACTFGIDPEMGESLALQTVYGTALLMKETGQSASICRANVTSPGGTTLAALEAMREAGFEQVFQAGVAAAVRRSKELSIC